MSGFNGQRSGGRDKTTKKESSKKGKTHSDDEIETSVVTASTIDMTSKKKKGKKNKGVDEDEDDNTAVEVDNTKESEDGFNIFESLELCNDKRLSKRETGLEQIMKGIRHGSDIKRYLNDFSGILCRILRSPSSVKEATLCSKLICLLSLVVGPDEQTFFTKFEQVLKRAILSQSNDIEVRSEALFALVFCCYICSSESNEEITDFCINIICNDISYEGTAESHNDDEDSIALLQSTAASCLMLILSTLSNSDILELSQSRIFESLSMILESNDIDAKMATGELIGYLFEVAYNSSSATTTDEPAITGLMLCNDPNCINETLSLIRRIAKDCSKKISKRDKKEQRTAFRIIELFIFEDEKPHDIIRFQGCVVETESFVMIKFLEFLRIILEDGFQAAPKTFPVIQDILQIEYITNDNDGDGEVLKVQKGTSTEKKRSSNRKQDRKYREMTTEFSNEIDGYDD